MKDGLSYDCPNCGHELEICCIVDEGQDSYLVRYKCPGYTCPTDSYQVWEDKKNVPSGIPVYWKLLVMQQAGRELKRDEELIRKSHRGLHAGVDQ
jgi:transcription elongation factor Elf1